MSLRNKMLSGEVCLGSWVQTGDPVVTEIMANCGYDWIAMDMEHTDINTRAFSNCARVLEKYECVPMARVRENSVMDIRSVLDAGAMGVIIPLVNNANEAKNAVAAAKYPPVGIRGFAYCRANEWGVEFSDYAKDANDNIAVIVMIESKEAVENIDEILSVYGIDGIFIGPYDMSGSYGILGQTQHEIIINACGKVATACRKYNKVAGQHIVIPTHENVRTAIDQGFTFIALGMDTVFIRQGAAEVLSLVK